MNAIELEQARVGLYQRLNRLTPQIGENETPLPGLFLYRHEAPRGPKSYFHESSLCLITQGRKRVFLGDRQFDYDAQHYLISAMGLPVTAEILEASPEKPYLGLTWKIDQRSVSQLIVEMEIHRSSPSIQASVAVSEVTQGLLLGCIRLLDLLEEPENIPVLAPLVQKELLYRLLVGDQGALLYQIGSSGTTGYQVAKSVAWLKSNFAAALRVEDLAMTANMSPSAFHSHFRSLTSMSPLQYQKWLRLQEARRLMLAEHLDASEAAFQVGYESPSQFSREYRRLFGTPPSQDIKVLRQGAPHHLVNV